MKNRLKKIAEKWFLTEPALFSVFCMHFSAENSQMKCLMRTGKGRIEYNPLAKFLSDEALEELVYIEMVRVLLKHPYERLPENTSRNMMTFSSDLVLSQNYHFQYHTLFNSLIFEQVYRTAPPENKSYEQYIQLFKTFKPKPKTISQFPLKSGENSQNKDDDDLSPPKPSENHFSAENTSEENQKEQKSLEENQENFSTENTSEETQEKSSVENLSEEEKIEKQWLEKQENHADLWEEDAEKCIEINEIIENTKNWGSLSGKLQEIIEASTKVKIDYRSVLRSFKTSILSSERRLTRMKPNRRAEFEALGSRYEFSSRLLIAIDVSGSVSSQSVRNFLRIINRFFAFGVKKMEVIQFDTEIKGEVLTIKKAQKTLKIKGRGGTNFQAMYNFVEKNNHYDGVIFFTDGYASPPVIKFRPKARFLWILENEECYNSHKNWLKKFGKVTFIQ